MPHNHSCIQRKIDTFVNKRKNKSILPHISQMCILNTHIHTHQNKSSLFIFFFMMKKRLPTPLLRYEESSQRRGAPKFNLFPSILIQTPEGSSRENSFSFPKKIPKRSNLSSSLSSPSCVTHPQQPPPPPAQPCPRTKNLEPESSSISFRSKASSPQTEISGIARTEDLLLWQKL